MPIGRRGEIGKIQIPDVPDVLRPREQEAPEVHVAQEEAKLRVGPIKRKTPAEQFDFFVGAIETLHATILKTEHPPESVGALIVTLPRLIQEMQSRRDHYIAVLNRTNDGREDLEVSTSYLLFGTNKDHNQEPHMRDFFLSYAAEKLDHICREYFDVDTETFKVPQEVNNEKILEKTVVQEPQDIVLSEEVDSPARQLVTALKSIKDVAAEAVMSVAGNVAGLAKLAMRVLAPKLMLKLLMKQAMTPKESFSQNPGAGSFFDDMYPIKLFRQDIVYRKTGQLTYDQIYLSTERFTQYDPKKDRFIASKKETPQPYRTNTLGRELDVVMERLRERDELFDLQVPVFPDMKDPNSGLCRLPTPALLGRNTQLIPIDFRVFVPGEDKPRTCKLHFDQDHLYFDAASLPKGAEALSGTLEYTTWNKHADESLRMPLGLNYFVKNNPGYFTRDKRPQEVDTVAADAALPKELENQIAQWQQLPTVKDKVEAVRKYFSSEFSYGKGLSARLRIATRFGMSGVEKIAQAKEGNCFDANKLAYIILQKLGVPAEMNLGFAEADNGDGKDNVAAKKPFTIPDITQLPIGTEVGVETEQALQNTPKAHQKRVSHTKDSHGHAFLRYFNPENHEWNRLDVTPNGSKLQHLFNKREEASREKEEDVRQKTVERITQERGYLSFEEVSKRWEDMHASTQQSQYLSTNVDIVFRRKTTLRASSYSLEKDLQISEWDYEKTEQRYIASYERGKQLFPILESFARQEKDIVNATLAPLFGAIDTFIEHVRPTSRTAKELQEELQYVWKDAFRTYSFNAATPLRDVLMAFMLNNVPFPECRQKIYAGDNGTFEMDGKTIHGDDEQAMRDMQAQLTEKLLAWKEEMTPKIAMLTESMSQAGYTTTAGQLFDSVRQKLIKTGIIDASDIDQPDVSFKREAIANILFKWNNGTLNGTVVEGKYGRGLKFIDPESKKSFILYDAPKVDGFDKSAIARLTALKVSGK